MSLPRAEPPEADTTLEQLRDEVRHARQRLDLYRAKTYGPRPTSMTRLRELERTFDQATARLEHARSRREG